MVAGDVLGRYRLLGKLATGGMAEVYLARQEAPRGRARVVVIKVILPHFAADPRFVKMFLNEARLAALINHPNVVSIYELGRDAQSGSHFMAMEWIDGANLKRLIQSDSKRGQLPPPPVSARMIADACAGLDFAHNLRGPDGRPLGLVHRDISPENILITYGGEVKLVDFGIAKAAQSEGLTQTGQVKGKFSYMAPEILMGRGIDRRSDVWALGVTLYWMLCGSKPFAGENEGQLVQRILNEEPVRLNRRAGTPPSLAAVVEKALRKAPAQRHESAKALQVELEAAIAELGGLPPDYVRDYLNDLFPEDRDADRTASRAILTGEVHPDRGTPVGTNVTMPVAPSHSRPPPPAPRRTGARLAAWALGSGSAVALALAGFWTLGRAGAPPADPKARLDLSTSAASTELPDADGSLGPPVALPALPPPPVEATMDGGAPHPAEAAIHSAPNGNGKSRGGPAAPLVRIRKPKGHGSRAALAEEALSSDTPGVLEVRVSPWADVFLDGQRLGTTPFEPVSVPPGLHRLRLVNDEIHSSRELLVDIKPGEDRMVKAKLE